MSAAIVGLGKREVRFGVKDDADRIKNLVDFDTDPDLCPGNFAGLVNWPEGCESLELFAVNFPKALKNYDAVLEESVPLISAGYERGGFPHLAAFCSPKGVDILYRMNIIWLEAMDSDSLIHRSGIPYLCSSPICGVGIGVHRLDLLRDRRTWFLFFR